MTPACSPHSDEAVDKQSSGKPETDGVIDGRDALVVYVSQLMLNVNALTGHTANLRDEMRVLAATLQENSTSSHRIKAAAVVTEG